MTARAATALETYLFEKKRLIDEALERCLPDERTYPPVIFQACRHSLFAGGKRLRPILCLAAAEATEGNAEASSLLPAACALELIHTYSLIHDDLPAMDNDDYRRGRPTSHRVFGEDIAILAGDALLTEAFHLMARRELMRDVPPERLLEAIRTVAEAAGYLGMVGGQVADIKAEGTAGDLETLLYIHTRKTASLIRASLRVGALLRGAGPDGLSALSTYGDHIGLAFQIADDILNVEGDSALLGKKTGSDACRGKLTYPGLLGLEAARLRASELVELALAAIENLDDRADPLRMIARYIKERKT
ncbi:MAG: polyprenyl synthetase family protein [Deltaproteobacteria bacterium]|nr:polyprenyl synthetase family protein [Deltaproteobacteria bacterium]